MGLLQSKIAFKLPTYYLKSKRLQVFFAWCKIARCSFELPVLASERVLSGPNESQRLFIGFWTSSINWDTQSQPAARIQLILFFLMEYEYLYQNLPLKPSCPHGPLIFKILILWLLHLKRRSWTYLIAVIYTDNQKENFTFCITSLITSLHLILNWLCTKTNKLKIMWLWFLSRKWWSEVMAPETALIKWNEVSYIRKEKNRPVTTTTTPSRSGYPPPPPPPVL